MKTLIILFLLLLNTCLIINGQDLTYKSMTEEDMVYIRMDITFSENIATITRTEIDPEDGVYKSIFFDKTDLTIEDGVLTIPEEGKYWFIPFSNDEPTEMQNGGSWCYSCGNTYECTQGVCDWQGSGCQSCVCGSGVSNPCNVRREPCDGAGGSVYRGVLGVFLQIDQVIIE